MTAIRYVLIVVEGPHDEAVVGRLLRLHNPPLSMIRNKSAVRPYWLPTIPSTYPKDDDITKRPEVPSFYQSEAASVAILSSIGDSRIAETVDDMMTVLGTQRPDALGVVVDADADGAHVRYASLATRLASVGHSLDPTPGVVTRTTSPQCGAFVLPDNSRKGTLECLLEDAASLAYPDLLTAARNYSANAPALGIDSSELREYRKPAGKKKAAIASMGALLKPGKSIQVSIQDNLWITESTVKSIPAVKALADFVGELLR